MVIEELIHPDDKALIMRALLLRHRHVNDHSHGGFHFGTKRKYSSYSSLQVNIIDVYLRILLYSTSNDQRMKSEETDNSTCCSSQAWRENCFHRLMILKTLSNNEITLKFYLIELAFPSSKWWGRTFHICWRDGKFTLNDSLKNASHSILIANQEVNQKIKLAYKLKSWNTF